jgi:hypothetical protein
MRVGSLMSRVWGLLFLIAAELGAQVEPVLLSNTCFDSLPYGSHHICTAVLQWRSADPVDTLLARVEAATSQDSASPSVRRVRRDDLVFAVDSHRPDGCCRESFGAVDSLEATSRLRFEVHKDHNSTLARLVIEGSSRTYEGERKPLHLVLCYLAHYSTALGVSTPEKER